MDDSDPPTYSLQDGRHPGDSTESGVTVTYLPSASDENENELNAGVPEHLSLSYSTMGKTAVSKQDSLNNNESCLPSSEVAASERAGSALCQGPQDEQAFSGKDRKIPGKRGARTKKVTAKKIPPGDAPLLLSAAMPAVGKDEAAAVNADDPPESTKLVLQPLFSLIHGEVEQVDSRALPLCLHQIAESYFQEEDYEKAVKFIQLERLYHEQLLANLSAIQEQWETKWKTVQPHTVTPLRNSEKGFSGEDFERLVRFCTTHQDPLLPKHKVATVEKSLGKKCLTQLIVSEDPKEKGATPKDSESEPCSGVEPRKELGGEEQPLGSSACCSRRDTLAGTAGQGHTEEPLRHAEATLELHTQSPETARSGTGPGSSENAFEGDSHSPAAPTEDPVELATGEVAEDPEASPPQGSTTEPSDCDCLPLGLTPGSQCSRTHRTELHLPLREAAEALPTDRLENNELREAQQPDLPGSDGKPPQGQTDSEPGSEKALSENNKVPDLGTPLPEVHMAPEERGDKEDELSQETEDYLHSLLEGCLQDAEDSPPHGDTQDEDSDPLQDLSPDEASYSLQESLPSDESCLSLDDLAKRIEIAEVVPAEGLVSILKKRNDSVGDHPAHMQQRPSKRRVRFQEIDDGLDQDDVGGGSCILLILLCIATVFLSVGGTALYCTFGDMDSPVCTDFADNVDFYYTKLLQGMAGLKHWVYLS